jgi:sulfotransferase family protein
MKAWTVAPTELSVSEKRGRSDLDIERTRAAGPKIEITEVLRSELRDSHVHEFWWDAYRDDSIGGYSIVLKGWVIGASAPVNTIQLGTDDTGLWYLPVNRPREDVFADYPDISWSASSGFYHSVSALKLPKQFKVEIVAVVSGGGRVWMGSFLGSREGLPPTTSRFKPIAVTTLGRTGSTWLVALLGQHPDILAFRPFDYEPALVAYWTDAFGALSEPGSYGQFLSMDMYGPDWFVGNRRLVPRPDPADPDLERWLSETYVEDLASVCKDRVDSFYDQVAALQDKRDARYFVEKLLPGTFSGHIFPEMYPEGIQLFLVRDFRDMFCSILATDRKRGFHGFGRKPDQTDYEYLLQVKRDVGLLVEAWNRSSNRYLVRYEEIVLQPHAVLAPLLSQLGVESSDSLIGRMVEEASKLTPSAGDHRTTGSPEESIGRWQHELDDSLKAACEEAFGEMLEVFGYPRHGPLEL